jgi:hypothetical protein
MEKLFFLGLRKATSYQNVPESHPVENTGEVSSLESHLRAISKKHNVLATVHHHASKSHKKQCEQQEVGTGNTDYTTVARLYVATQTTGAF